MVGQVGDGESAFVFPGALKTYANLGEGKNLVVPNH
jgi:hypothetical protein